jgi:hypothetical protein
MKTLFFGKTAIAFTVVFSLGFPVIAQEAIVKTLNQKNGSDAVTVKNVTINPFPTVRSTSFEIQVDKSSNYYLSILWHGFVFERCDVVIDNGKGGLGVVIKKDDNWEIAMVNDNTDAAPQLFSLTNGKHTIVFKGRNGKVPNITNLQIGESMDEAKIKETESLKYVKSLKNGVTPVVNAAQADAQTVSVQPMDGYIPPPRNPAKNDYSGFADLPLSYTYFTQLYLTQGSHEIWYTNKSPKTASDPVLYLFKVGDPVPSNCSWYNDNGNGGYQAKIDVTIPTGGTGSYILVARAKNSANPGTSDLYHNGSLYASNITLAGYSVTFNPPNTSGTLNYFTANPGAVRYTDPLLFIANNSLSKIQGYNDDYYFTGTRDPNWDFFDWGYQSRIKTTVNPHYALISSYTPVNSVTFDFYAGNEMAAVGGFPHLNPDDAIKSGEIDNTYCCYGWAGGRTDMCYPDYPWQGADPNQTFDFYFGNMCLYSGYGAFPRWVGAISYEVTPNAGDWNAVVDLYSGSGSPGGGWAHASVTKTGDGFLHGFDWESKDGSGIRFFHPRLAIRGTNNTNFLGRSYKVH